MNASGSVREVAPGGGEPAYDQHRIATELQKLRDEADGWETWFGSQSISPVRLAYEDLAADPAKALEDLMEAIGRPVRRPLPDPGTARLANHINDDWASRFRRETGT
jgi:LPS sulfotransferase NodH